MNTNKELKIRVRLEPELEDRAAAWSPEKREAVAAKLERWVRQLRISAAILKVDRKVDPPRLKAPRRRTVIWN